MTMARLNISLPRTLLKYVETQVHGGGYSTPSEYFRSLIRDDQKRKAAGRIEALLIEGLASGKPIAVNSPFWNKKRSALTSRHCKHPRVNVAADSGIETALHFYEMADETLDRKSTRLNSSHLG